MQKKKAVILVNVGSPDKPAVSSVRKFLTEFLNDPRVIDLPFLLRKFLVNIIIIPLRVRNSTKLYKALWTEEGSPLRFYQERLKNGLSKLFSDEYEVFSAMRYGNPHLKAILNEVKQRGMEEIILVPLFPQYASSTTGTVIEFFIKTIQKWEIIPKIKIINQFYYKPGFIDAFLERASRYDIDEYDHVLFSYHGLPDRHILKTHPGKDMYKCACTTEIPDHGTDCYKATCHETTRILARKLNIPSEKFTVCFQSRLSKNWLTPFANEVLKEKAEEGKKNILVFSPAFVTDCLETIIEIKTEYQELFLQYGGEKLDLVESLNDSEVWINGLYNIITET